MNWTKTTARNSPQLSRSAPLAKTARWLLATALILPACGADPADRPSDGLGISDATGSDSGVPQQEGSGPSEDGAADTDATDAADTGIADDETGGTTLGCMGADLTLLSPFQGTHGDVWVISAYPDIDPATGIATDYTGGSIVFDGLVGTIYTFANFRVMDQGYDVRAPAAGVVEFVADSFEDRNISTFGTCEAPTEQSNQVRIRHANGFATVLSQLRRDSALVAVGDVVAAGQRIGAIGGSGCTGRPGLLLEVLDCDGDGVDPFSADMWVERAAYDAPTRLHDSAIRTLPFVDLNDTADPGPNLSGVAAGTEFAWALYWANSGGTETVTLQWRRPEGGVSFEVERTLGSAARWVSWGTATLNLVGNWEVDVLLDGVEVGEFHVQVH